MSTIERSDRRVLPPLVAGQRLDQRTFHERYEAMPEGTRAELIGGIVSMPSPLSDEHGGTDDDLGYWLAHYRRFTPGLRGGKGVSTILGKDSEVQPDSQLRIPEDRGGQSRIVGGCVSGPPELVAEISRSSLPADLGGKREDYERAGVLEYLIVSLHPEEIFWFVRRGGIFERMESDAEGLYRSEVFPGLWLDPKALFAGDLNGLVAPLERGIATPEHATFVARLVAAGAQE